MSKVPSPEVLKDLKLDSHQAIANGFSRVFSSPDGLAVLGYLNTRYFTCSIPPNTDHTYACGSREVMAHILEQIQMGENNTFINMKEK